MPDRADAVLLAHHEAGHAVMASVLGRPVRRASVRATNGLAGYVDFEHAVPPFADVTSAHRPLVETDALVLLAGRAAECEYAPGMTRTHAGIDRAHARRLLATLEPIEEVVASWLAYLLVRAQAILQDHWPLVFAVARALLDAGELDRRALATVLDAARRRNAVSPMAAEVVFVISPRLLTAMDPARRPQCAVVSAGAVAVPPERLGPNPVDIVARDVEDVLALSGRARGCLHRAQIRTIGDLLLTNVRDLRAVRALGAKTLAEILGEVGRVGLTLAETPVRR